MESVTIKVARFRTFLKDLEDIGNEKNNLLIIREGAEVTMHEAEDKARNACLTGDKMGVTLMAHYIKAASAKERMEFRKANSNYRVISEKYELVRELLNGTKKDVEYIELLANNSNL